MKKIMIALAMAGCHGLAAQTRTDSLLQSLGHTFQPINGALVPSGRLYDRGLALIDPHYFSQPSPDSVRCSLDRFAQLYITLQTAEVSQRAAIPSFHTLMSQSESFARTEVPMAFADLDYDYLIDSALLKGKVRMENNQVIPVGAYIEFLHGATARAVAPTRLTARGPQVGFFFPAFLWQADDGKTNATVELDFGTGQGWQAATKAGRVEAHFTGASGPRTIAYRIVRNGTVLDAGHFDIHIIMSPQGSPDTEWDIVLPGQTYVRARAHITYANPNFTDHLIRPLIIVEGVDYAQIAPDLIPFGNWGWTNSLSLFNQLRATHNLSADYNFV